jgi:hypothetical protein
MYFLCFFMDVSEALGPGPSDRWIVKGFVEGEGVCCIYTHVIIVRHRHAFKFNTHKLLLKFCSS